MIKRTWRRLADWKAGRERDNIDDYRTPLNVEKAAFLADDPHHKFPSRQQKIIVLDRRLVRLV